MYNIILSSILTKKLQFILIALHKAQRSLHAYYLLARISNLGHFHVWIIAETSLRFRSALEAVLPGHGLNSSIDFNR